MLRAIAAAAAVGLSITTTAALGQNLMEKSIAELARMVKAQEVTAVELVETAIAHAKAQAGLNAFITLDEERALAAARQIDAISNRWMEHIREHQRDRDRVWAPAGTIEVIS